MKVNNSKDVLGPNTIVALYVRVSTSRQEKEKTIDSQIDALKKHCCEKNYIVYNIYKDDGYSGNLFERPELDRLRDDACLKKFDAVICFDSDRLARNSIYRAVVKLELERIDIPIIFLTHPTIASSPGDKLLENMQAVFAEYESEKIRERTRRGKKSKAERGIVITSQSPYGFRYIKKSSKSIDSQRFEVDRQEFETVLMIIKWFVVEGLSYRAITRRLEKLGIKTKKGKVHWSKTTVKGILSNPIYTGIWYYNKRKRVSSSTTTKYRRTVNNLLRLRDKKYWIGINIDIPDALRVNEKTFAEIQRIRSERKKHFRKLPKHKYLLSGLLFCAKCKRRFSSTPFHDIPYYRCSGRKLVQGSRCNSKSVKAEKIDRTVLHACVRLLGNPRWLIEYVRSIRANQKREIKGLKFKRDQINTDVAKIKHRKEKIIELFEDASIDKKALITRMEKLNQEEARLHKEKNKIEREINEVCYIPENFVPSGYFIDKCISRAKQKLQNADFGMRKQLLHMLIEKVIFSGSDVTIRGYFPMLYTEDSSLLRTTS